MIPIKYLPKRVMSLMHKGAIPRKCAKAAALFCYFEEHEWLLYSGTSTNFPKGYKVQTSSQGVRGHHKGLSQDKPPTIQYNFLRAFLIENRTFVQCATLHKIWADDRRDMPSTRTLHRDGKRLLRQYLEYFDKLTNAGKIN